MPHILVVGVMASQERVASVRVGEEALDHPLRPLTHHCHKALIVEGSQSYLVSYVIDLINLWIVCKRKP